MKPCICGAVVCTSSPYKALVLAMSPTASILGGGRSLDRLSLAGGLGEYAPEGDVGTPPPTSCQEAWLSFIQESHHDVSVTLSQVLKAMGLNDHG